MDKIRITGVRQGKRKLSDDTYAIGLETTWDTAWLTTKGLRQFLYHNKHLQDIFQGQMMINSKLLIGKYIYVQQKIQEYGHNGTIIKIVRM